MQADDNIVLIGMPGVGKSTVGVLLAKATSRPFVDTDLVIQALEGRRLQEILEAEGTEAFRAKEERSVLALDTRGAVVATGGSVVYSGEAMAHLKEHGELVFLDLPMETLERRITNMDSRGVVMEPGQTLADVYAERMPLYRRYADIIVDTAGLNHDEIVAAIEAALELG